MLRKAAWATALAAAASICFAGSAEQLRQYNIDTDNVTVSGLSAGAFFAVQYHMIHSSKVKGKCSASRNTVTSFVELCWIIVTPAGVGVLAGGPFFCAEADVALALTSCMNPSALSELLSLAFERMFRLVLYCPFDCSDPPPDPFYLAGLAKTAALYDNIDDTVNLKSSNFWFFSGKSMCTVGPLMSQDYDKYGAGMSDTVVHSSVVKTLPDFYEALGVNRQNIETVFDLDAERECHFRHLRPPPHWHVGM
jgi:hypothetical protein